MGLILGNDAIQHLEGEVKTITGVITKLPISKDITEARLTTTLSCSNIDFSSVDAEEFPNGVTGTIELQSGELIITIIVNEE